MEAKAAQSSIEDDATAMVKKHFGKSEGEKRIVEDASMKTTGVTPETKTEKEQNGSHEKAQEQAPAAPQAHDGGADGKEKAGEAPVKKRKYYFVSNPHNSKMQTGGQRQNSGGNKAGAAGNNGDRRGNGNHPSNNANRGNAGGASNGGRGNIMRAEPEERQETVRTAIRTVLQEESVLNSPS